MRMKRLDCLESPGLPLLSLFFRPDNRFPIRCKDQARARVGDFHAVAPGFVDIQEKSLLDGMFVWAGFDEDSVLKKNIGGAQNVFAAIDGVGDVVEAAARSRMIARVSEIVTLVADREPHARFRSIVHHDLLGEPATQVVFKKYPVRLDIDGEAVQMIESPDVDAASR